MRPGFFTATAIAQGAPLWAPRVTAAHLAPGFRADAAHPAVWGRVPAGTRLTVHAAPSPGGTGMWWQVVGGPHAGRLVRQHDPAWSVG